MFEGDEAFGVAVEGAGAGEDRHLSGIKIRVCSVVTENEGGAGL